MRWQFKLMKNALFGLLPFPGAARWIKRAFVPYPTEISDLALEQALEQVEMVTSSGYDLTGKSLVELGPGWQPLVTIMFLLGGCRDATMIDRQRLMDRRLFLGTIAHLLSRTSWLSERLGVSASAIENRLSFTDDQTLDSILDQLRIRYLAPSDITSAGLQDATVDIAVSRAVLEHIERRKLKDIFLCLRRMLRADGIMCHIIDNSDHWEHADKRIARLNFLKFNHRFFEAISSLNPLDYQNRMRHCEYLGLLSETGFRINADRSGPDAEAMAQLARLELCEEYRNVPHGDLAILDSRIVASKAPDGPTAEPCWRS